METYYKGHTIIFNSVFPGSSEGTYRVVGSSTFMSMDAAKAQIDILFMAAMRAAAQASIAADTMTPAQHAADTARYAIDYKKRQEIFKATGGYTAPDPSFVPLGRAITTPAQAKEAVITKSITAAPAPHPTPTTEAQRGLGVTLEGAKAFLLDNPLAIVALAITFILLLRR